jgi:hypothetical protein
MLSKKNKKYRSDRLKLSSVRSHAAAAEIGESKKKKMQPLTARVF